jgi:hypothetical protein
VNDGAFSKKVTVGTVNFTPLVSIITYFIVNLIKLSTVGKRGCPGLAPVRGHPSLGWSQEVWGYGPEGYGQKYGPTRAFYNYYLTSLDHHNYLKGCNVDKKLI